MNESVQPECPEVPSFWTKCEIKATPDLALGINNWIASNFDENPEGHRAGDGRVIYVLSSNGNPERYNYLLERLANTCNGRVEFLFT